MGEAKQLVCETKARLKQEDLNLFDWDLTDGDQGILDTEIMVFVGFTPMLRKKVLNDIQHSLTSIPFSFEGVNIRATLELDPIKRSWVKAQNIFT